MLVFDNPEVLTVNSARIKNFTVFFASDRTTAGLELPVVRATVEQGSLTGSQFTGARSSTVTVVPPESTQLISGVETIVRSLLEHMQRENFLPSGTIQE